MVQRKVRAILTSSCFEAIGVANAQAICGFHILTDCDQISQFYEKTKLSWWKSFLKADNNILNTLSQLGTNENLPVLVSLSTLERFLVNTYGMCYALFKVNSTGYSYSLPHENLGKHRSYESFRRKIWTLKIFLL